jgi:hypothetical protein
MVREGGGLLMCRAADLGVAASGSYLSYSRRAADAPGKAAIDPGCVKTLRGIAAPGILSPTIMRRAKKRKNSSSARHYDQIRFRFRTAKTPSRHSPRC